MTLAVFLAAIVVAMAIAIGVGEVAHRRRPVSHDETHGGFRLDVLAGATLTLAVIMCSFMLAISYSAYDAANRDAGDEAGTVAALYEAAYLLPDRGAARDLDQATICYARAVVSDEWPRLGTSTADQSSRVEHWRQQIETDIIQAEKADPKDIVATARDADLARTTARQTRLATADKQAPYYLFFLLIIVCAVAIMLVTAFTVRGMPARLRLSIVALLTVLLGATLVVINDLDHPFIGISTISSGFMHRVEINLAEHYQQSWNGAVNACDSAGRPSAS